LRVLGLRDGNGFEAMIIPQLREDAAEDGSFKSNELEEKLRISSKK
jgi:hypothetical protein